MVWDGETAIFILILTKRWLCLPAKGNPYLILGRKCPTENSSGEHEKTTLIP